MSYGGPGCRRPGLVALLLLSVACGVILGGCRARGPGQTLTVATEFEPTSLDPAVTYDASSRVILQVYENLVTLDGATDEIVPQLAVRWTASPDLTVFTFELRPTVRFHDGTPLDAAAVKLSLERLRRINKGPAWMFRGLEAVEAVGEREVRITLREPDASFLKKLASATGPQIISPKALREHATNDAQDWLYDHEAGTGPYTLESWERGQKLSLSRFAGYWGGWSGRHLESLTFLYIRDGGARRAALERGEADVALGLGNQDLEALAGVSGVRVSFTAARDVIYMIMKCRGGPLQDPLLRQAVSFAFDYQAVVRDVYRGRWPRAYGPLPEGDPWRLDPGEFPYRGDLARARELVAASSRPRGGFSLTLGLFAGSDDWRQIAEMVRERLGELGIKVVIESSPESELLVRAAQVDTAPDLMVLGNYPDYADPTALIANAYLSSAWGSLGWNFSYYASERVESLFAETQRTASAERRFELVQDMQRRIVADAPAVWIVSRALGVASRRDVQGFALRPLLGNSFSAYAVSRGE